MKDYKNLLVIASGNYIFGAEKVTINVIEGLRDKGYNITALISKWGGKQFPAILHELNIKFVTIKLGWYYLRKISWSLDSLVHYPGAIIKFIHFKRNSHFNYYYIISFRQVMLLWPFISKNLIYHVHDPNSSEWGSRGCIKFVDRKVLRYIAVSDFIKRDLMKCGVAESKIKVIYNGVPINNQPIEAAGKNEILTLGIVGQIIERKGHEDVIKAVSDLVSKGLQLKLIIVGRGDEDFIEKITALINELELNNVVIWKSYQETMIKIYEDIDVVIAASRTDEPFGLVALETNMFSRPIIASNKGGFPESVVDGVNGFLVDANAPEQIAEKIEYFYKYRGEISKMGANGRDIALKNFTKEKMIDNVDKLFQSLN